MVKKKIRSHKSDLLRSKKKTKYQSRDNVTLRVAKFLNSKGEKGATIYNIIHDKSTGLSTQDQTRFTKEIIEPMIDEGWVEKVEYSKRVSILKITSEGKNAMSEAFELYQNNSLIAKLIAFKGLVD